jgi:hypothetical protein
MPIAALLPLLTPLVEQLVSHIPDPQAREKARAEAEATILTLLGQQQQGQVEINKIEAAHAEIFVSGWRPFIGWVCGVALAYTYIVAPFWAWMLTVWYPDCFAARPADRKPVRAGDGHAGPGRLADF